MDHRMDDMWTSSSTITVHEYMNDRITIEHFMLKEAYKGHEIVV